MIVPLDSTMRVRFAKTMETSLIGHSSHAEQARRRCNLGSVVIEYCHSLKIEKRENTISTYTNKHSINYLNRNTVVT